MRRVRRIIRVTLSLAGLGAAAGASIVLVAHTILLFLYLRTDDVALAVSRGFAPEVLADLLLRGALLGALVGPPVAWALLRRVPIGWAVLGVATGALVGGLGGDQFLGEQLGRAPLPLRLAWLWGALAGVVLTALALRWLFRPSDSPGSAALAVDQRSLLGESWQSRTVHEVDVELSPMGRSKRIS